MTKERLNELKLSYLKEVDYYEKIGFPILQGKFQEFVNILVEIEEIIDNNEKLGARVQVLEDQAREKILKARAALEGEEDNE